MGNRLVLFGWKDVRWWIWEAELKYKGDDGISQSKILL